MYDRKSYRIRVEQDENHADEILDFMPVGAIFYNYTRVNVSQCKWEQLIFLGPSLKIVFHTKNFFFLFKEFVLPI